MIPFAAAILFAQVTLDVRQVDKDARVTASMPKSGDLPVVLVCRRVGTMKRTLKGMQLAEAWRQEQQELAVERKGTWEGSVSLSRPGRYEVRLGPQGARLSVSRADFEGWEKELRELRAMADRVRKIAAEMDRGPSPDRAQVARWRRDLLQERAQLERVKTEFDAGKEALRDAIDRLRFFGVLAQHADEKPTSDEEGYEFDETAKDPNGIPAAKEVEGMSSVLVREGAVKLLDEVILVLGSDPEAVRLNRWKDAPAALAAIARAHELLGGPSELGDLLREAKEGAQAEGVVKKARDLRARQVD